MNADAITYPASLTKMMTLYLTFEALNSGRLRLDQYLPVSSEAASKSPTKLHLVPGDSVQVHDLILGIVTKSANDAAAVLAEGLAGSEPAFADRMTAKARQLGMTNTVYRNASGLPDPEQRTTARDVAQLALALYHDFPREYRYFATRQFFFRGRVILTHNHLLDWYDGADGIKTGYIGASGFNLAASAVRNGHRLIGVVMGGASAGSRDREMAALLDRGLRRGRRRAHPGGAARGAGAGRSTSGGRDGDGPGTARSGPPARENWPIGQSRPQDRRPSLAGGQGRGGANRASAAHAGGNRPVEHPARCVPRRECGRAGGAYRRHGSRSQRQAGADRAAFEGQQGARLPRAAAQFFAARKRRACAPRFTKRRSSARWSRQRRSRWPSANVSARQGPHPPSPKSLVGEGQPSRERISRGGKDSSGFSRGRGRNAGRERGWRPRAPHRGRHSLFRR